MTSFMRVCLALLVLPALLSGCWDRRELNDLAIAVAIGLDKDGDRYKVSAQIVNPGAMAKKGAGGGGGTPVVTYQTTGSTIVQALRRMTMRAPRPVYTAHLRIVVLGEQLAREGIAKTMDYFVRDQEVTTNFHVLVAKGASAEQTLRILTALEKIPADHIASSLQNSERTWAAAARIGLNDLAADLMSDGKEPAVAAIEVSGDPDKGKRKDSTESTQSAEESTGLRIAGMAVFKKDKLIGWLDERESKGFNYTQDRVRSTVVSSACPDGGNVSVELDWMTRTMKGSVVNGRPAVHIDIQGEGNVAESHCKADLEQPETISELEKRTNQATAASIEAAIRTAQHTHKADIFGFGETIHRHEPNAWHAMKKDWDKRLSEVQADVHVDVKIRRLGTVTRSLEERAKG